MELWNTSRSLSGEMAGLILMGDPREVGMRKQERIRRLTKGRMGTRLSCFGLDREKMVRLGRFELPTSCFGGTRSIHLSYSRVLYLYHVVRLTPMACLGASCAHRHADCH
jgi:hypothetical protein